MFLRFDTWNSGSHAGSHSVLVSLHSKQDCTKLYFCADFILVRTVCRPPHPDSLTAKLSTLFSTLSRLVPRLSASGVGNGLRRRIAPAAADIAYKPHNLVADLVWVLAVGTPVPTSCASLYCAKDAAGALLFLRPQCSVTSFFASRGMLHREAAVSTLETPILGVSGAHRQAANGCRGTPSKTPAHHLRHTVALRALQGVNALGEVF